MTQPLRKLYSITNDGVRRQSRLKSYRCGWHRSEDKTVWECFAPVGISLSVWVRMESPGRRTRFVYDAGGGFKRNLLKTQPADWESLVDAFKDVRILE
jgi:hypothetical protein